MAKMCEFTGKWQGKAYGYRRQYVPTLHHDCFRNNSILLIHTAIYVMEKTKNGWCHLSVSSSFGKNEKGLPYAVVL